MRVAIPSSASSVRRMDIPSPPGVTPAVGRYERYTELTSDHNMNGQGWVGNVDLARGDALLDARVKDSWCAWRFT